ncbi:MAG TPA: radical SAM protein [Candidatus Thermoplasmatota archaeon]|nr:radical SAM protein [Candidatus Thermoplasmatota archaeon]
MSASRVPDDARHPVLSRARPVSQTALQAYLRADGARRLPPGSFGKVEVREVDAASALTASGLPGSPWSLNPYVGCAHDCAYCYVPDTIVVERKRWSSYVIVKRNLPTLLARELARKERAPIYLSSATDAWQPAEATHLATRRCLELIARADWPVRALTRSPLVTRDIDLLDRLSDVLVGLSIPTLDDAARRAIEPAAPPIAARLAAVRALADAGLRPFINLIPAYPLTGGVRPADLARAFADAGAAIVHAGAWQYLDSVLPVVRERLPPEDVETFVAAASDAGYMARYFRALRAACKREGVRLEVVGEAPQRRARREIRWLEGGSGRQPPATP